MKNIYLDYNATSPLRPEVLTAMEPYFKDQFGNPSSFHRMGQKVRHSLEEARETIRKFLGKNDGELIFTSSATEANNLAILGLSPKRQVLASPIEHLSVLKPLEFLKKKGVEVDWVVPSEEGEVSAHEIIKRIKPETDFVTLMAANNETGVLQPVHQIKKNDFYFHVDAVQVFGKMKFDFSRLDADCISISAHKIGGPKGIGALWMREGLKIEPILFGGHHEKNLRPGTENLPAVIGFAKAAEVAFGELEKEEARIRTLRDWFESEILNKIADTFVNGAPTLRLPNTSNLSFVGVETETLLMKLDSEGVYASSGSACTSGSIDPSHVLLAMNLPKNRVRSAIRFSLGHGTRKEDLEYLLERLPSWIKVLRG